jgi:superoxide dismutase, Fe-Mn family
MDTAIKSLLFLSLPYAYTALEPHFDAMTMEIHYSKHHQAYFNNLKAAAAGTDLDEKNFIDVLKNISNYPTAVRNNGGGHYNHTMFWESLSPDGSGTPKGKLLDAIVAQYGSFEAFREKFNDAAKTRFGSGWAWLSVKSDKSFCICSTPNQDNPLMDVVECRATPILGLDVWEHAYYLKFQNRRPDYVNAFWNLVNWEVVEKRYLDVIK